MTQTMTADADTRDCHLYRFYVRHPLTGQRVLGYIGETVRQPFTRLMEHIGEQPWVDTILGWEVDSVTYPGKAAVLRAEAAAIRAERPLYNVKGNETNPCRVKPWDAKRQRWARDDEKGRPRWVPPKERPDYQPDRRVPHPRPRATPVGSGVVRRCEPWQAKVGLWVGAWSAVTVLVWLWLDRHEVLGLFGHRWHGLTAALAVLMLVGWSLVGAPTTRRQFRALRRRWSRRVKHPRR